MPIEIRKKPDTSALLSGIRSLTRMEVLVGVPAENAGRQPEPGEERTLNNAEIGYVQEFGSTIEGPGGHAFVIPPRPHRRPAVADANAPLAVALRKGAEAALKGEAEAGEKALHSAGLIAQNAVRNKITEGPFVPLAPATLQKRRGHGRAGDRPIIDSGAYRNSISYVIRPKDKP